MHPGAEAEGTVFKRLRRLGRDRVQGPCMVHGAELSGSLLEILLEILLEEAMTLSVRYMYYCSILGSSKQPHPRFCARIHILLIWLILLIFLVLWTEPNAPKAKKCVHWFFARSHANQKYGPGYDFP